MVVFVNSKEEQLAPNASVQALLDALKLSEKRVAVEVNRELVTKHEWAQFLLKDGDKVEIVTFVGGG